MKNFLVSFLFLTLLPARLLALDNPPVGLWPRWSPNGREVYYEQPGGMLMAVAIEQHASFDAGVPKPLFRLPRGVTTDSPVLSGITPDGKRSLVASAMRSDEETGFQVILDWQAGLKK